METSFKGFRAAKQLNNTTLKGMWRWAFFILLYMMTYVIMFTSDVTNAYVMAFYVGGISVLYSMYDANINSPLISNVLPLSNKRRVKYGFGDTFLTIIGVTVVLSAILLFYSIMNGTDRLTECLTDNFPDTGATLGSAIPMIQAITISFAYIPLTFERSKKAWYIKSSVIYGVNLLINLALCNIADKSGKFVCHMSISTHFSDIPNYKFVFAVYCVFSALVVLYSYIASIKAAENNL